ncbi:MAG: hypothetical protein EZS26_000765 [Candidatus Ordinivivax streblomastigis]|uniref:NUMOD4 domain-containing protein n=1 Tax=Candidatus Ordinivivax streblomastigis TaxID=2540710 RepID=A0A5M8P4A4_9BACT|nr:MAG: hypothetical protein EZS26_000765 [Candidatus Ordinivivax streblomastigis]
MEEIFKNIHGYEGLYQVSNFGRVKSCERFVYKGIRGQTQLLQDKILKQSKQKTGYLSVVLYNLGKKQTHFIHRLVAIAFIPNPENLPEVNHKDENKCNNFVDNLDWITSKNNCNFGTRNERIASKVNTKHIFQYELNGKFVKGWESAIQIQRELGFSRQNILCNANGKTKKAYNYIWKYTEFKPETAQISTQI